MTTWKRKFSITVGSLLAIVGMAMGGYALFLHSIHGERFTSYAAYEKTFNDSYISRGGDINSPSWKQVRATLPKQYAEQLHLYRRSNIVMGTICVAFTLSGVWLIMRRPRLKQTVVPPKHLSLIT
jgi:hypothetical protein